MQAYLVLIASVALLALPYLTTASAQSTPLPQASATAGGPAGSGGRWIAAGTISLLDRDRARGIAVQGGLAYIGVGARLVVLDVSELRVPRVLGESAPLRGEPYRLAVQGSYAYLAAGPAGLLIVDVSDPRNIRELGVYLTEYPAWDLAVEGRYLYLAAGDLHIIDIADPGRPARIGFFEGIPPPGRQPTDPYGRHDISGVAVRDGRAYPRGRATMRVIDVRDPSEPHLLGTYVIRADPGLPGPSKIIIASGHAYIVNLVGRSVGIHIVDLSDPANPARSTFLSAYGALAVDGNLAYLANERGFTIIDVTHPQQPRILVEAPLVIPGGVQLWGGEMTIVGSQAFVTSYDGLCIVDLSDRLAPTELGCYYAGPPWLQVTAPTQVLAASDDPLWTAQPGEWYRVGRIEVLWESPMERWALTVREGDPPERPVWIQVDDRVQLTSR